MKPHKHTTLIIFGLIVALGFLIYVASVVKTGPGSMVSKASRDVFLTQDDDALSLQEDLKALGTDAGGADEQELNTLQ